MKLRGVEKAEAIHGMLSGMAITHCSSKKVTGAPIMSLVHLQEVILLSSSLIVASANDKNALPPTQKPLLWLRSDYWIRDACAR